MEQCNDTKPITCKCGFAQLNDKLQLILKQYLQGLWFTTLSSRMQNFSARYSAVTTQEKIPSTPCD